MSGRGGKESRRKKEYKKCENRVKKLIRNRKNAVEKQVARDSKTNPKRFYSFINSAKRSRSSIGPLTANGELVTDLLQQARSIVNPPSKDPTGIVRLDDVVVSEVTVKNAINRIHEFASPGPDDVTNKIIVELKDEIADPLSRLLRKSLDEMKIPSEWRMSNVTPIYKLKGSKADPGNYRPVSLTSNVCKLMERVINVELSSHLEKHVLSNNQHGFRKGRSCQTNLKSFRTK